MSTLHTMALLSELIYSDWPEVHKGLAVLGLEMMGEPFNHAGSQGMLVCHKRMKWAALVFRGTEASKGSITDIFSNIGLPRSWAGEGKAHGGYKRHFAMIRYDARQMAEQIPSGTPLYVTGHSMGGSLATMYAAWVGSGGPDDHKLQALITFGAPKTLSEAALACIPCPGYRVTNKYDFAPYWPPVPGLGHPEVEVEIDSGGWWGPVSRHGTRKYVKALETAVVPALRKT